MENVALHPRPRWSAVIPEQFRAVGLALRREWLVFALALAFFTLLSLIGELREAAGAHRAAFDVGPDTLVPVVILGFFAPLGVWKRELPGDRGYFWSLPVDRSRHTLAKVAVGWGWVMGLVAVYVLWAVALAAATGGSIGVAHHVVPAGGRVTMETEVLPGWMWVVPFTATTLTYLVGSVLVLASDHPWIWMAGILVALFVVMSSADAADLEGVQHLIGRVLQGRYGAGTALAGSYAVHRRVLAPGGNLAWWSFPRWEADTWILATLLWGALAAAGVLWAANRRPEE
jgi:hypothetical protein